MDCQLGELSLSIADQLAKSFDQAWLLFKEVSDGLSFDFQEVNFADAVNGCTAGAPVKTVISPKMSPRWSCAISKASCELAGLRMETWPLISRNKESPVSFSLTIISPGP